MMMSQSGLTPKHRQFTLVEIINLAGSIASVTAILLWLFDNIFPFQNWLEQFILVLFVALSIVATLSIFIHLTILLFRWKTPSKSLLNLGKFSLGIGVIIFGSIFFIGLFYMLIETFLVPFIGSIFSEISN